MISPVLPTIEELQPALDQLQEHPGSTVLIAINWPRETQNYPAVSHAWMSAADTKAMRRAIASARKKARQLCDSHSSTAQLSETDSSTTEAQP